MRPTRYLYPTLALALALSSESCSEQSVTAPPNANTTLSARTRSGLESVESALESPAWRSLDALAFGDVAARAAGSARHLLGQRAARSLLSATLAATSSVEDISQELARRVAAPSALVIPADARGTTYVFDPEQHRYVADPAREGAPENGVRYILYAIDPLTGEPKVSIEIGHADLADLGNDAPDQASLRLVAVSHGTTFVDYTVALAGVPEAGELAVNGTFFDGTRHLVFAIRAHSGHDEEGSSFALHFDLGVPEDGFTLANEAHAVATTADQTVRAEQAIHVESSTLLITSVRTPDGVDATVQANGARFAVIHGDGSTLVVVGSDGEALSTEERDALGRMLGLFDGVSRMLGHLLQPVAVLFALVPLV